MNVIISDTKELLGQQAAEHAALLIRQAIHQRGTANIIIATGPSQNEVLASLVRAADIHWPAVTAFHLDEYIGMPITHPASFRLYLWEQFVRCLPLPLRACHYICGEQDPRQECARVGQIICEHPIDVALVGIGENGHMAFNDPPADFEVTEPYIVVQLDERCRLQQVNEGHFASLDDVPTQAISMSIHQVLASRAIVASVPDRRKAEAVRDSIENPLDPRYPSTCLQKHEQAYIYLDVDSASLLSRDAVR